MADEAIRLSAEYCAAHDGILLAGWGGPKGRVGSKRRAALRFAALGVRLKRGL
jgi:hypothetical protein